MPKNWAIAIGINKYDNQHLHSLKYAMQDAKAMQDFFEEARFDKVFYFSDETIKKQYPNPIPSRPPICGQVTYSSLMNFLANQFQTSFLNKGDSIWFFFSGHGIRHDQQDCLMACDADPNNINATKLSIQWVAERLWCSGAEKIVLILDICRKEREGLTGDKISNQVIQIEPGLGQENLSNQIKQHIFTIFSCLSKETSQEFSELNHGVFTYELLNILKELGARNCATAGNIDKELRSRVPALCQRLNKLEQTPQVINISAETIDINLLPSFVNPEDIYKLQDKAIKAEEKEDYGRAIQLYIEILKKYPSSNIWVLPKLIELYKKERPKTVRWTDGKVMVLIKSPAPQGNFFKDQYFYVDKYPVTVAQYKAYLRTAQIAQRVDFFWNDEKFPATNVSAQAAEEYAKFYGKSLPTLKQWRCAATGDPSQDTCYPWGNFFEDQRCNSQENWGYNSSQPTPVDQFPPQNNVGVCDIVGNVAEIVRDDDTNGQWFQCGGYHAESQEGVKIQSSQRRYFRHHRDIGFRCVATVSEYDRRRAESKVAPCERDERDRFDFQQENQS